MDFWRKRRLYPIVCDFGSHQTRIMYRGKLLFAESSLLAMNKFDHSLVAIGGDAWKLQLNNQVELVRPITKGRIRDFNALGEMIKYLKNNLKIGGLSLPPDSPIMGFIPLGLTAADQERWQLLWQKNGIKPKWLLSQTDVLQLFASVYHHHSPQLSMLDIGEAVSRLIIVTGQQVVYFQELPFGMLALKQKVDQSLKNNGILMDEQTLGMVVESVASLNPRAKLSKLVRVGRVTIQGLTDFTIHSSDLHSVATAVGDDLVQLLQDAYSMMPANCQTAFDQSELLLLGGGANLAGIVEFLQAKIAIRVNQSTETNNFNLLGLETWYENH